MNLDAAAINTELLRLVNKTLSLFRSLGVIHVFHTWGKGQFRLTGRSGDDMLGFDPGLALATELTGTTAAPSFE